MKKALILLFALFAVAVTVFAEVPNEIRYNGRLRSYGNHMNGTLPFNFKIYGQEEGGTALWESGDQRIKISSGIFSYTIKPNKINIDWRNRELWLQVVVDTKELKPREKLMTVPYAFHSESSEKLSANNEIEIEINDSKVYIGIEGKKLYYKSSKDAEIEYLGVPAGTVIAFAGNKPPKGYLSCDGREVEVSKYPDLFAAIGTIYGGNASSKFKLPDFRGMFLRGTGGNSAPLGQYQGDAIRNITGGWNAVGSSELGVASGAISSYFAGTRENSNAQNGYGFSFDAARVVPTANENRPVNYAVNYCIKY